MMVSKWDVGLSNHLNCAMFLAIVGSLSEGAGQTYRNNEHKQLDWRSVGGCVVTFVNTPCRTVRYHDYSYGTNFGFYRTTEVVEANEQSGSESYTRTSTLRPWWFWPERIEKFTQLLLRPLDTVAYIDHDHQRYETHPGAAKRGFPTGKKTTISAPIPRVISHTSWDADATDGVVTRW